MGTACFALHTAVYPLAPIGKQEHVACPSRCVVNWRRNHNSDISWRFCTHMDLCIDMLASDEPDKLPSLNNECSSSSFFRFRIGQLGPSATSRASSCRPLFGEKNVFFLGPRIWGRKREDFQNLGSSQSTVCCFPRQLSNRSVTGDEMTQYGLNPSLLMLKWDCSHTFTDMWSRVKIYTGCAWSKSGERCPRTAEKPRHWSFLWLCLGVSSAAMDSSLFCSTLRDSPPLSVLRSALKLEAGTSLRILQFGSTKSSTGAAALSGDLWIDTTLLPEQFGPKNE